MDSTHKLSMKSPKFCFFFSLALEKIFRAIFAHPNSLGTVCLTNRHSLSFYFSAEKIAT